MSGKWWILAAVACGTFMVTLDSSIVNIALPSLTVALGTDLPKIKWVVIAYLLTITCLLLPMGRISDLYGKKKVFLSGFLVFALGSGLCGLSGSLGSLVFFRVIQAFGGAMLMANGPAIISSVFTPRERGSALGTLAMVVSLGLITGPALGGYLISRMGWPTLFWVNIPVAIMGVSLVYRLVRPDVLTRRPGAFDWAGAFVQMLWLLLFIVLFDPPAISISGGAVLPISRWILLVVVLLIGAVFIQIERQARSPLFDLSLLKNATFASSILASFLFFVCLSPVQILMPFYLENVLNFTPQRAGVLMSAVPITILVVAPISGRLSDRLGSQGLSLLGSTLAAVALWAMAGLFGSGLSIRPELSEAAAFGFLILVGAAVGLFQSPNNSAIMSSVPTSKVGLASALLATVRNLGLVSGTGLATSLVSWRMEATGMFLPSYRFALAVGGVAALLATIASFWKKRGPIEDGVET